MRSKHKDIVDINVAIKEVRRLMDRNGRVSAKIDDLARKWKCSVPRVNYILKKVRLERHIPLRGRGHRHGAPVAAAAPATGGGVVSRVRARLTALEEGMVASAAALGNVPGLSAADVEALVRRTHDKLWEDFAEFVRTAKHRRPGRRPKA